MSTPATASNDPRAAADHSVGALSDLSSRPPCRRVDRGHRCLHPDGAGHSGQHVYTTEQAAAARKLIRRKAWRDELDVVDGVEHQPISAVTWVDRNELRANGYNPNHVAPPELRLLKVSILSSGWTQPIVARPDGEIVDGFHRWTVSGDDEVQAMTGGQVPVVYLRADTPATEQQMATIRHNRARGTHHLVKMADIVDELRLAGLTPQQIAERLQMDPEEVDRLLDRGSMTRRHGGGAFSRAWGVKPNNVDPQFTGDQHATARLAGDPTDAPRSWKDVEQEEADSDGGTRN